MYNKDTIRRYILFQIPELILIILVLFLIRYFFDLQAWIIWLVAFLSVIKDGFMYRFTWKSYIRHKKEDFAGVKGKKCIAEEDFTHQGLVKLNGELWKTEVDSPVKRGDVLVVTEVKGLLLVARKIS